MYRFKKNFLDGKYYINDLLNQIYSFEFEKIDFTLILLFLEYNKNYDTPSSEIRKLVTLVDEKGCIAESLLDYSSVNKNVYKKFLDLSMRALSKSSYLACMVAGEDLRKVITEGDEGFAYLIMENNINRWLHIAERKEGPEPHNKYQRKVKRAKNSRDSAGDWTEEGILRFFDICNKVRAKRLEEGRHEFENEIKKLYELDEDAEEITARNQKRLNALGKTKNKETKAEVRKRRRLESGVTMINMFNVNTVNFS